MGGVAAAKCVKGGTAAANRFLVANACGKTLRSTALTPVVAVVSLATSTYQCISLAEAGGKFDKDGLRHKIETEVCGNVDRLTVDAIKQCEQLIATLYESHSKAN